MSQEARPSTIHAEHTTLKPFSLERIIPELHPYVNKLKRGGYERLIPLLNEEIEGKVLYGLEKCLVNAIRDRQVSSQPRKRRGIGAIDIREKTEEFIAKMEDDGYIEKAIMPNIRVIPPEKMNGLCAPINIDEPIESQLTLTHMGKAILSLMDHRSGINVNPEYDRRSGMSMFYIAGRASEANEFKPQHRRWGELSEKSYRIPILRGSEHIDAEGNLRNDFDFLIASPKKPGGYSIRVGYSEIVRSLKRSEYKKQFQGDAEEKESKRRSGFNRVELTSINKRRAISLGHIFGPGFKGQYNTSNRLLPFLMEGSRVDIPVLIVPYYHENEGWIFWGLAVDFFGGLQDVAKHRLKKQLWGGREYSHAFYPSPDVAFSQEVPQELLFHLGRDFRNYAFGDKHPIMGSPHMSPISEEQLDNVDNLNSLYKQTQEYLSNHVIFPFSQSMQIDRSRLGYRSQRLEFGISLLEDITKGLEGDPIVSILRLLPSGVSLTQNPQDFLSDVSIYGFGIFDKKGLFPELGRLLDDRAILTKFKNEIYKYQYNLEQVKNGLSEPTSGKRLLYDIIPTTR